MRLSVFKSKIHRATVTQADLDYEGSVTIDEGLMEAANICDYEMVHIDEMPAVEVYPVPTGGFWGGIGEPFTPPVFPAVCNAIFAATGKRVRSLPLKNHDLRKA